jgi:membrane associated rhomboid family serine protease
VRALTSVSQKAATTMPGSARKGSRPGHGWSSQPLMAIPPASRYPWPLASESTMFPNLAPVTRNLLIANVAVFLLQMLMPAAMVPLALWPLGSGYFQPWQIVTNAFMHGGWPHLLFNMYALFMFGSQVERALEARNYTIYYFVCLITASILQLLWLRYVEGDFQSPTVGASGAIFGLLLAFGLLWPRERMIVFPIPAAIPALPLVLGYAALELVAGVLGWMPGIAHFAHLGGMLGGYVMLQYLRGRLPIKPKRRLLR